MKIRHGQIMEAPKGAAMYFDYFAFAIHARWPDFTASDMLTGQALGRYRDVTEKGCWNYAYANDLNDPEPVRLKPGWGQGPAVQAFISTNEKGEIKVGPMLVIAGDADRSVPLAVVKRDVASVCEEGSTVVFRTYPGLDHDPLMTFSTPDQLAWIADRFKGKPLSDDCGVSNEERHQ